MADSSSSSITHRLKYDVFLSFRGEDTRDNFTSHLRKELLERKIETYTDDRLEKGDEIPLELTKAIEQSKISIVIFSKNYAFSSWCLDELVHILECKERNEQFVVPVFYCVNPSDVRKQEESYATAFSLLEERFKDRMDKVHQWRKALIVASNLCGWDSNVVRPESKLIEAIVGDILKKLKYCTSASDICPKGLVGIDKRVKKVETFLRISSPKIRIVGIWGMGGIGKSTLASVVFDRHSAQFESCCFLANVREESEKHGLISLRNKLLGELLKEENPRIRNSPIEPTVVGERLRHKKVLIVLDDVNKQEQLECLARNDWFCFGSKIIVTTRDIQLLRAGADEIYEVEELDFEEALQLFNLHAFGTSSFEAKYKRLSKRIINCTRGNPLALKVLGSYLHSRTIEEWECALNKLKVVPNMDIHKVLKISYDALDDMEKDIFLDIACFFKGNDKDFVESILDGCGFFPCIGIKALMDKSLITIEDYNKLSMHDLIQEMGWEIVRQQCIKEPGKRSRLWIAKDVCHVFKYNTVSFERFLSLITIAELLKNKEKLLDDKINGRYTVEGISLDKSKMEKDINLHPTTFLEMYNIRLLQIYNSTNNVKKYKVYLPQGLQFLPDSLRYLEWSEYPLRSLPSNFTPENLVALDMSHSQLEQVWDGIQNLSNLKHINLSYSRHLTQIPDLSQAPNLETINLLLCTSLFEVGSHNIQNLHKLTILRLRYCEKLLSLPDKIYTRALKLLDLYGCSNLKSLPEIHGDLESLQIGETAIEELPSSILSLSNLCELDLKDCKSLKNLPSGMHKLISLTNLNLYGCSSLKKFPELPKCIKHLCLSHTAIEQVPSSIEYLCDLEKLLLSGCSRLEGLPTSISKLNSLKHLDLSYCSNFIDFPNIAEPMEHLITLQLQGTGIKELSSSIENLIKLQELLLNACENLRFVPNNIGKIQGLKLLNLSNCAKLENLPSLLVGLSSLTELHMSCCNVLECPTDWLIGLSSLEYLDLSNTNIDKIPTSIKQLSMFKFLYIQNCKNLQILPELPLSISFVDAHGCMSLKSMMFSMTAMTQACWDDYHVTQNWQLSFYECTNLDRNEQEKMATEFQFRVLCTATAYLLKLGEVEGPYAHRAISICYPGDEIPKWFNIQSEGSSIDVKLSPNWNNDNFMGFALCAVVSFEDHYSSCDYPIFSSEFSFKTNYSQSEEFEWSFYDNRCHFREEDKISNTILRSDHVFMCYELSYRDENYRDYFDAAEVSFNFFLREYNDDYTVVNSFKVKRCGIRMLYLQDAEEFGIIDSHSGVGKSYSASIESEQCDTEMVNANYKRRRLHY